MVWLHWFLSILVNACLLKLDYSLIIVRVGFSFNVEFLSELFDFCLNSCWYKIVVFFLSLFSTLLHVIILFCFCLKNLSNPWTLLTFFVKIVWLSEWDLPTYSIEGDTKAFQWLLVNNSVCKCAFFVLCMLKMLGHYWLTGIISRRKCYDALLTLCNWYAEMFELLLIYNYTVIYFCLTGNMSPSDNQH